MFNLESNFGRSANACRLTLFLLLAVISPLSSAAAKVTAHTGEITLPTYDWAANKHPHFRGTDGKNIYPYPMLDFLSRDKTNRTYRTVVLENEYLRITFLPELGGKIHEVLDKTTGQPMFYVNHVVKPGLIGQCGAWTSGGVEWNAGPQGHTVSCMQPVDVVILPPEKDGARSVAIGETERIYHTKWTVVVTLRPGRSFIEERIRIYNPTETVRPYYFWNCTAVPNTPGFRFIYPMTLGCDHAGEKFFNWPVDNGKDLTRGTNYQDASSVFAWHCDQDFFGSYNDNLDRGVVVYANHHQLPGKKAWTWGHGGFGKMHQMDLTDDDGPYNEVQTGPLLTQAQVGRLDPCEAVEWKEWWYPIHGIGGFTFANTNLAANLSVENGKACVRMISTRRWPGAKVIFGFPPRARQPNRELVTCQLDPAHPTQVEVDIGSATSFGISVISADGSFPLVEVQFPMPLPSRTPPAKKESPKTASEFVAAGWQRFLFAQFSEAETQFHQALGKDPWCRDAHVGLAHLNLDRDPAKAADEARTALEVDPDHGPAHYALAVALVRSRSDSLSGPADYLYGKQLVAEAMDHAWNAALDPTTAVAARALLAKLYLLQGVRCEEIQGMMSPGPWQTDPLFRNRLAFSASGGYDREIRGKPDLVDSLVHQNLELDPLDFFARSVSALNHLSAAKWADKKRWAALKDAGPYHLLDLDAQLKEIRGGGASSIFLPLRGEISSTAMARYHWSSASIAWLRRRFGDVDRAEPPHITSAPLSPEDWPFLPSDLRLLRATYSRFPTHGRTTLLLGHLLFHLGRHTEGREMWKRAAELGAEPVIAYRALGMAAKTLDNDLPSAREWLTKANQADPKDAIVARDLANVLFALADKAGTDAEKRALATEACDRLQATFAEGKGRSDFVGLLARAQNRLDEFAETARMLDTVRVTIWEGAHEVHDLFVQSHLALGEAHLKAGRAEEALAEFIRALEYPANLATSKLENAREAHINFARGNALFALDRRQEAIAAWKKAADEPASSDTAHNSAREKARSALQQAQASPR